MAEAERKTRRKPPADHEKTLRESRTGHLVSAKPWPFIACILLFPARSINLPVFPLQQLSLYYNRAYGEIVSEGELFHPLRSPIFS